MSDFEIHSLQFLEDGVVIQYMELPTDVRARGRLIRTQSLRLHSSHPDYERDVEELAFQIKKVLKNALQDFEESEPFAPDAPVQDVDDEMGSATSGD